jgi:predicted DNA-binding protein with PD1-like motif
MKTLNLFKAGECEMSQPVQTDTPTPTPLQHSPWYTSQGSLLATRLDPGTCLKSALQNVIQTHSLKAAVIVSCVGSLHVAHLRLAGAKETQRFDGPFEIVSLVGTLSPDGVHIHISIANAQGQVLGGHLLDGNLVHTTAELVLMACESLTFSRPHDSQTGYGELKIGKRQS